MALADARALCPGLVTAPADLQAEQGFLRMLLRWAERYSPLVGAEGADGLVADISGVAHLFGGEEGLRADMAARLARAGLGCVIAIADSRAAAFALARHGGGGVAPAGAMMAHVGRLPVVALRIDEETATGLGRLGLKTIADLTRVARAPLARRFGPGLMLRLDQITGQQGEAISAEAPPPHYGVRLTLPDPIGLHSDVMAGLERLLARLCATLALHQQGARRMRLELRRVDGTVAVADIGLARPMRDAVRILALFDHAAGDVDAGFGIDQLRLTAPVVERLAPQQLNARAETGADRLTDLITRLGNRLGFEAVQRFLPAESHIPEKSFLVVPAAYCEAATEPWPQGGPDRPVTVFPPEPISEAGGSDGLPPRQFRWRRMRFRILRATGPERIAPEWWLDDPAWRSGLRDYWKVETAEGRRLWLFHTPQAPGWAVQGEFA